MERAWAVFTRPEMLASDPGEIDDGHRVLGKSRHLQRPIHHAAQPDGRARTAVGIEVAEDYEFGEAGPQYFDEGDPLPVWVGPENRGGSLDAIGRGAAGTHPPGDGLEKGRLRVRLWDWRPGAHASPSTRVRSRAHSFAALV